MTAQAVDSGRFIYMHFCADSSHLPTSV